MDINVVNTILRLCFERQTCLFEVPSLSEYCLEQRLCTNVKYVLASVKNFMEIFKISRDRNRIEFYMPFEICRHHGSDSFTQTNGDTCQNLHVCYDYFYANACRRSINCPYPHILSERYHENILGTLINLDLDVLTKAFRVYCQSKKHLLNYSSSNLSSSRGQQATPSSSSINNSIASTSSSTNNWRLTATPQISGSASWKTNNQTITTTRIVPTQPRQQIISQPIERGLQICWTPQRAIQTHFVEVVFSNQGKSAGGPIRTHTIYQHLGLAQVFYQNSDILDRVIRHGPVTFQSFTFTPRLLQRTIDLRHVCFSNMPVETNHIPFYLDTVSMPYKKSHFDYYQNDKHTILVEYNEDIDFSKISSNLRNHPECNGSLIKCIQLHHPETLFLEYDQEYSEDDIKKLLKTDKIFHIQTYSSCAFVHFYSHDDLMRSIKTSFDDPIRMTPIYIEIYSQGHLDSYLKRHSSNPPLKRASSKAPTVIPTNGTIETKVVSPERSLDLPSKPVPLLIPTALPPATNPPIEIPPEALPLVEEESSPPVPSVRPKTPEPIITSQVPTQGSDSEDENVNDENEQKASDDDFHDLPSEFDNEDLFLDESTDNNGDMEFLRSAAKNLMSSLTEMEEANSDSNTMDAPHSLLYGDDYVVTIKSRRFALAFLDYTQFRVEKQRNPDTFRLLASLKKQSDPNGTNQKKRTTNKQRDETPSPTTTTEPDLITTTTDTKSNKKRRNKNKKKKKHINPVKNDHKDKAEPTPESVNEDEDDETANTEHVLNDRESEKKTFPVQRLPHVYLDDHLKPCIVVAGEEHHDENGQETSEHEDWHDIVAGGKAAPVSKRTKKRKQQQQRDEKVQPDPIKQNTLVSNNSTPTTNVRSHPQATELNSVILSDECRGFVHHPKLYETFRLRLRRSFPSINIHFHSDTYTFIIDGNIKPNVQSCLQYLNRLPSSKYSISIAFDTFPQTTATNVMRMQQSTAQVKLDPHADYNRIFRSTARLIDYQVKQHYNQQLCIYCRRSKKQFRVTYLEFPSEKQSIKELNETIQQRVVQLLTTRFTYIAIALSAELMTTERWKRFFKNLSEHTDRNKTILIRKIDAIIQIYGLHAHVQQVQTLITKFLDANRYETDVLETEQAQGIFSLFKSDFQEMENLDLFREAELRFVYFHRRRLLLVQCFQEKFEMVKSRIQKLRSQLSTALHPVKSPILRRYYSKSNEIQRISAASSCVITIESGTDPSRPNDHPIHLKITSRSAETMSKAQRLIREFEEQKYSTRKIHHTDIHLFTDQDIEQLQSECSTCNVSCTIEQTNNSIELEGLSGDFVRIEKIIHDFCLAAARRALDDIQYSTQWVYYDVSTNKSIAFGETIKQQLEKCYSNKQKGLVKLQDHTGQIRTFDLDKMLELIHGSNPNATPTFSKIERRDFKNPRSVQLPASWTSMTKPWDRVLLARRDNTSEWKTNMEIQKLLKLPNMLPESWIVDVSRVQNPRMYQQYIAHKENFAARSQDIERTLYRLAQQNVIDDMCAHGFNRSHTDAAFSAYGHGCHFYCKAIDIDRTATLLAQNFHTSPILLQQQTSAKPPLRYLFVCKVLVGRYTRGDASMKTCPPGYDSLVDNIASPEVFVTHQDAQVLPEYLITYQSALF